MDFLNENAFECDEILRVCQRLHAKNYLAACDGNVSFRRDDGKVIITPSARPKAFIKKEELAMVSLDGEVLAGKPSGEMPMHLEIFRQVSRAKAVVHAHPPVAIAWSIARPQMKELPSDVLSEVVLAVGKIPIVPFQIPGTQEMGSALNQFLPIHQVMILARHGALAWGETLEEAYMGIERLEHAAVTLMAAEQMGGFQAMKAEDYEKLLKMRAQGPQRIF